MPKFIVHAIMTVNCYTVVEDAPDEKTALEMAMDGEIRSGV